MAHALKAIALSLSDEVANLSIDTTLALLDKNFPGVVTFSTSFSNEDQVITDLIDKSKTGVKIFTLDTGRLFEQTYATWASTNAHYGIHIKPYSPNTALLEEYLEQKGPNAFYQSVENRKECCNMRKVIPLKKALKGNSIWITGIRAAHSAGRQNNSLIEWDEGNQIIKYNPLLHWTDEQVTEYIYQRKIPYNAMHDKGFLSIGCAHGTRAVRPGEDFRAGRWWWEESNKECGLHTNNKVSEKL